MAKEVVVLKIKAVKIAMCKGRIFIGCSYLIRYWILKGLDEIRGPHSTPATELVKQRA